jgi:TPR repeat protein
MNTRDSKWLFRTALLAMALAGLSVRAEDSPQAMFDKGFDAFIKSSLAPPLRLQAWALMEKAAAAGNPDAKITVAEYDAGLADAKDEDDHSLLKPNMSRALAYFRDMTAKGSARAQVGLAVLYSSGIGEPRTESESPHNLLVAAAKQGNGDAMSRLSDRYAVGHGERVDVLESARWRFIYWQTDGASYERTLWLDEDGNPRKQENVRSADLADMLALFVKAVQFKNADAIAALKKKYADAGKPDAHELEELLKEYY